MNPPADRSSPSPSLSGSQPPEPSRPPIKPAKMSEERLTTDPTPSPKVSPVPAERQQPIPPPSYPRQYRAIGLIRGQYLPCQEKITRGVLLTAEGTTIDMALLGRLLSLVKKHLDLEQPHLWVVYPRTREEDDQLHVQVVGVWEPETLSRTPADELAAPPNTASLAPESGYFSIRGEVVYASTEKETVIVKIRQSAKKEGEKPKYFKLKLKGTLPDKPVGHFWDLQVQLQGNTLVLQEGTDMGQLPSRRKPGFKPKENKPYPKGTKGRDAADSRPLLKGKTTAEPKAPPKREPSSTPIKRPRRPESSG